MQTDFRKSFKGARKILVVLQQLSSVFDVSWVYTARSVASGAQNLWITASLAHPPKASTSMLLPQPELEPMKPSAFTQFGKRSVYATPFCSATTLANGRCLQTTCNHPTWFGHPQIMKLPVMQAF